jgi:ABC-type oligopeptide transport system ATPase subunit
MHDGEPVEPAEAGQLYDSPQQDHTRALLAAVPALA